MDAIAIQGGTPLRGEIQISGAKNAALPLMIAALLSPEPLTLARVPDLADIATLKELLAHHGVQQTDLGGGTWRLHAPEITSNTAPHELVRRMRASILVLGPLLARCGEARVSMPGGCAIGNRPVDLHIMGLERMGATISISGGFVHAKAPSGGLRGERILLPMPSVGATENLMMAAALATGETEIVNAAREPEIGNLAEILIAMGAQVDGLGSDRLRIQGTQSPTAAEGAVIADRIETGTYAMAAAITGGDVVLKGAANGTLDMVWQVLERSGAVILHEGADDVRVTRNDRPLTGIDVMTEPFPGFPTDLQAQYMALMSVSSGAAMITETIFENRFQHVPELIRMGANITIHGRSALVRGSNLLVGAPVEATDLRASSSLVLAGLAAKGETLVQQIHHLDRGYEQLEAKLSGCGAQIQRITLAP